MKISEDVGSKLNMSCDGNAEWMAFCLLETLKQVCIESNNSFNDVVLAYLQTEMILKK